ncbi:MAG: hypothetical protein M1826_006116 [Phylliscum demangeonii]|nr:MAG: hypothetical protein M1826_006116 [Phylliscum demangeonii]
MTTPAPTNHSPANEGKASSHDHNADPAAAAAATTTEMGINPARAAHLLAQLESVRARIHQACQGQRRVRLVAVSKLKPASDILALHQPPPATTGPSTIARQVHFGENYVQELAEKAGLLPPSIRWHFIGALQTNKCVKLGQMRRLYCVSGVDNVAKADALERGRRALLATEEEPNGEDDDDHRLNVHVQINTSDESTKSGVPPSAALDLCQHIHAACPHLRLRGLMTIGALARSQDVASSSAAAPVHAENEDFRCLRETRDLVAQKLGLDRLELSMGMSADFESAIGSGSDEVRVGSTIFGERPARKEAKV